VRKLLFVILTLLLVSCAAPTPQKTEITLTIDDFKFNPASITVQAGQIVVLTIKNKSSLEHDFAIQKIAVKDVVMQDDGMKMDHDMTGMDYDLHLATMAGETRLITFTPVNAGTYEFLCTIKGHKAAGMSGTLIVTK